MSTRERIIGATLELMTERGPSEVTMVDIARRAGVARATLYNHYGDVPAILADAAAHHDELAIAELHRALSVVDTPAATIEQLVRHVAAISAHGHTLTHHHGLPEHVLEELVSFDDELDAQIRSALVAGAATGEFRDDVDPATTTTLVRHMLNGVSELVAAAPDHAAAIVRDATATVLAAIGEPHLP